MNKLEEKLLSLGVHACGTIPVEKMHFDPILRTYCENNMCGNFGKNYMCPPDAGDVKNLIAHAKTFEYALVYQTVYQLEDSFDIEGMAEAGEEIHKITQQFYDYCKTQTFEKTLFLGAGGCKLCKVCGKITNVPCRFPQRAMASLETYGVAVSALSKSCGMKYMNGQDTVTSFNALLYTSYKDEL